MTDVCPCEVHEAIKADRKKWKQLPYVGHQFYRGMPVEEVRNCACKSTLYCTCDPEDEREILELMPHLKDAIHLAVAVVGELSIAYVCATMAKIDIGIVESHSQEAIRQLVEDGRVRVDPYYDENDNKVIDRKLYRL